MAETAPNKTVTSAGMRQPPAPGPMNPNLGSTPTHRVKKLLETYTMTAERSMLGPGSASAASEMAQYSKFYPSYHQVQTT